MSLLTAEERRAVARAVDLIERLTVATRDAESVIASLRGSAGTIKAELEAVLAIRRPVNGATVMSVPVFAEAGVPVAEAVAETGAAKPEKAKMRGAWRSAARAAVLDRDWPAGVPIGEIVAAMQALPGPPVPSRVQIASWARERKLARPAGFFSQAQAARWAEERGVAASGGPKSPRVSSWKTEARRALLLRDWPAGRALSEIFADMAAMEGGAVPREAISTWASSLGLRRPVGVPVLQPLKVVWSQARRDRLREGWGRGETDAALLVALNAVDTHLAPVLSVSGLRSQASSMGLGKRPAVAEAQKPEREPGPVREWKRPVVTREAAPVKARPAFEPAPLSINPDAAEVSFLQARDLAARLGVAGFDGTQVERVNKLLAARGQQPIVISERAAA